MSDSVRPPQNVPPRVSIVIVTYRSTNELPGCLDSVLRQGVPTEVFIVDNASPDDTPQLVEDYGRRFKNIFAVLNTKNVGLAAGNNCAIGRCRGEYVLIFNPDTILPDGSLERLVSFMDAHPDVGVVGPLNRYEDGTPHVSSFHSWGIREVIAWRIAPYWLMRRFYDRHSSYEAEDVLFVSGSCLLIRRRIFEEIGGYDPEYFLTIEDVVDLCIRARKTGCRVAFYPDAGIIHFTGRSGAQASYIVVWEGNRGTVYHFLKHKGLIPAVVVSILLIAVAAARVIVEGVLGIFSSRYRRAAGQYASVLWNLIVRNPIWAAKRPSGAPAGD